MNYHTFRYPSPHFGDFAGIKITGEWGGPY